MAKLIVSLRHIQKVIPWRNFCAQLRVLRYLCFISCVSPAILYDCAHVHGIFWLIEFIKLCTTSVLQLIQCSSWMDLRSILCGDLSILEWVIEWIQLIISCWVLCWWKVFGLVNFWKVVVHFIIVINHLFGITLVLMLIDASKLSWAYRIILWLLWWLP